MKTILVPTEQNDVMDSALQTALLLARKFDSYIEGFALRFAITDAVAMDVASTMPLATFERESQEAAKQARGQFETFMQKNHVPRTTGNKGALSFGWPGCASGSVRRDPVASRLALRKNPHFPSPVQIYGRCGWFVIGTPNRAHWKVKLTDIDNADATSKRHIDVN